MERKQTEIIFRNIKMLLFIIGIILSVYFLLKVSIYFIPLIVGFIISTLIDPLVRFIVKRLRIPRKLASFLSVLIVLSTVGFLIFLVISKLFAEIKGISHVFPDYFTQTYDNINNLINNGNDIFAALPKEIRDTSENVISNLSETVKQWTITALKSVGKTAISIPEAFIFTIVTILSTYFFSSDRELITSNFRRTLPDSWMNKMKEIKDNVFSAFISYFRAQMIIMSITFTELFIGFTIIGVKYSLLLSITVAVIDIMPVLGTGGVLIPWALYNFLMGDIRLGISLLILYVIVLIVRQIIEPKIVGQQIGLHPLITLTAMYAGLKLFGVLGMILGPITTLLIKDILSGFIKAGYIKNLLNKIRPPMNKE